MKDLQQKIQDACNELTKKVKEFVQFELEVATQKHDTARMIAASMYIDAIETVVKRDGIE